MSRNARSRAAPAPGQKRVDHGDIEVLRVERSAHPFEHLVVLGVRRVAEDPQTPLIPRNTATILGRTRAGTARADGNDRAFPGLGEPIGVPTQAGIAFLRLCTKPLARADKDQAAVSGLARSVSWSMAQAVLPDAKIFAELNFR